MDMQAAIARVSEGESFNTEEMADVMRLIMMGKATDAQIGGFLMGLRLKGETIDEITGAVQVMRELATRLEVSDPHLVDTCGTGGDGANIFNVSTASAFVVAAAGGKVAKHGNRSVSSSSGSADVLEQAGVKLDLTPDQVARCVREIGVGFMFAPQYHSAMRYAIGPRRELGMRTIFNLLGPLTNPAGAQNQIIGVFSDQWVRPVAEVLKRLGSEHVLVVHAADGLDEISIATETRVAELRDGEISEYTLTPEQFGIERQSLDSLVVSDAASSLALITEALGAEESPAQDMLALNAGAAIYAAGLASAIGDGVAMAQDAISSGMAREKLKELVSFCECIEEAETS